MLHDLPCNYLGKLLRVFLTREWKYGYSGGSALTLKCGSVLLAVSAGDEDAYPAKISADAAFFQNFCYFWSSVETLHVSHSV